MGMMGNIFNPDNAFFTFMGKAFDIVVLNLVWLLLYVPFGGFLYLLSVTGSVVFIACAVVSLVVFVPSMIALYYAVVKSIRRSRSYPVKEFFRSFKDNFRQGAVGSVVVIIITALLYMDFQYAWALVKEQDSKGVVSLGVFFVIAFFATGVLIYFCPVLSRFNMTFFNAVKFSLGLSAKHFWCTLLSFILWVGIVLLIYLTAGYVLFFGVALATLLGSFMMEKVLKKYVLETVERQKQAENEALANGEEPDEGKEEKKPEYTESFEDGGKDTKKDEWYLE
ncbi:MAG: DUF624 domain-containing protein [Lachnospiraceae bacterium]|nr:DUF624 domain-containing protein [Lachnospiraceae bacterium]